MEMGENSLTAMRKLTYLSTLVLTFALPWEDSISIPGIGSLARLMGFVAAACWVGAIIVEGKFRKPNLFHSLVLVFFLWNFVSLFWTLDVENTIKRIKTYSQIFLLVLLYWEVFQKPEELKTGLQAYVFGAYVLIGSVIYNYAIGNIAVKYEGRFSAAGVNANDVALLLILCLPIALQLLFEARRDVKGTLLRAINFMYIPLSIFASILTGSRTSLIAVIPFAVFLAGSRRIQVDRKLLIFGILIVTFLALFPFIPPALISRLGTIGDSISGADLGGRVTMWRKSIMVLSQYPIAGVGSGAIDRTIGGAVHNTLLSVVSETGFIGLLFFLSILGLVVYDLATLSGRTSAFWWTVFMTWVLGALSLSWEFRKVTWIILCFVMIESNFAKQAAEQSERVNFVGGLRQLPETGVSELQTKVS
jgi:O-antigen ligase